MQIEIRKILPADAASIASLSAQFGYLLSVEKTRQNIDHTIAAEDSVAFVVISDQTILGWIGVSFITHLESLPFCEINGMVVDENHRRRGIGKMLIQEAARWCGEKGCELLKVRSNVKRTETHLFYKQLGFKEIKQQAVFELKL